MRARHIEAFHAIYSSGSISTAARALNVSQPALSKVLKHAESQLGFALFRRVRGRLVPTDEAHVLFREVAEVHQRIASLRRTARNLRGGHDAHLRIAVLPSMGLGVAPAAVATYRREHPTVTFEIMTLHHDEAPRALFERTCDLAVAYDPAPHPQLQSTVIGHGEVVALYRADAIRHAPPRLTLGWLCEHDIIGLSTSGPVGDVFAAAVEQAGITLREVVSVQTFYLAAALAHHGAGIAIVDELTARAQLGNGLQMRAFEPALNFSIQALHLEDRPLSLTARDFLSTLSATLATTLQPSLPG